MANEFKVKHGLIVNGSGSVVLDIQGSQGQLFSITDSLSGSLFKVSDISGIPIVEVFSDDTVNIGTYGAEAIKVDGSTATVSGSFTGSLTGVATLTDLQVNGDINATGNITGSSLLLLNDLSAVSASFSGTATAVDFILSSDERMKENIIPLEITPPDIIWKQYNFKDNTRQRYGVIAQDIEKTHPELVSVNKDGMKSVSYIDLLVLKMAEKDKQIEELQKDIELLKMLLSK